jgi:hypothetical protein
MKGICISTPAFTPISCGAHLHTNSNRHSPCFRALSSSIKGELAHASGRESQNAFRGGLAIDWPGVGGYSEGTKMLAYDVPVCFCWRGLAR